MPRSAESKEEYLEAIFKLALHVEGATVGRVAEELGVAPASASQMLGRLSEAGLVSRDERQRIVLTKEGKSEATRIVRRHRLSERFLTDYLKLPWDQVHEEACKLEHALSKEVEVELAERLGNPRTCPHGRAIPTEEGEIPAEETRTLADLAPGDQCVISFVSDESPDLLRYLASLGLLPETSTSVEEVAPFGGPLLVRIGRARYALGREVAAKVFVRCPAS